MKMFRFPRGAMMAAVLACSALGAAHADTSVNEKEFDQVKPATLAATAEAPLVVEDASTPVHPKEAIGEGDEVVQYPLVKPRPPQPPR